MKFKNLVGQKIGAWIPVIRCENRIMKSGTEHVQWIVKCGKCKSYFKKISRQLVVNRVEPTGCPKCEVNPWGYNKKSINQV